MKGGLLYDSKARRQLPVHKVKPEQINAYRKQPFLPRMTAARSASHMIEPSATSIHDIYIPHPDSTQDNKARLLVPYLLDVVVAQSAAILKLLAGEDQTLLIRGNALLVLDLGLDVVDGVARLDVEGNGLTRQGLDETVPSALVLRFMFISGSRRCCKAISRAPDDCEFRKTYICTGNARKKKEKLVCHIIKTRIDVAANITVRTGCEFSLVSAVGRCVRGGGGDDNLTISRLAKVDRRLLPYALSSPSVSGMPHVICASPSLASCVNYVKHMGVLVFS